MHSPSLKHRPDVLSLPWGLQALMAETNQIRAVMAAIQQRQEQLQQQMDGIAQQLEAAPARKFKLL